MPPDAPDRRSFLGRAGRASLSAAAIGLLGGASIARAHSSASVEGDLRILNVALGLEHEAIGAYRLGAQSGLLRKALLEIALGFQSHHVAHRDALASTIQTLGGTPVAEKSLDHYASTLGVASLQREADVLVLAARLELGAANAYLGVIPAFEDTALAQVAARLAADEAMHWTVLTQTLGQALPQRALSFGG